MIGRIIRESYISLIPREKSCLWLSSLIAVSLCLFSLWASLCVFVWMCVSVSQNVLWCPSLFVCVCVCLCLSLSLSMWVCVCHCLVVFLAFMSHNNLHQAIIQRTRVSHGHRLTSIDLIYLLHTFQSHLSLSTVNRSIRQSQLEVTSTDSGYVSSR